MKLRSRWFLFSLILTLSTLVVAGLAGYKIGVSSAEDSTKEKLVQIRHSKSRELTKDFEHLSQILLTSSDFPVVKSFLMNSEKNQSQIKSWLQKHGSEGSWRVLIAKQYPEFESNEVARLIAQISPNAIFLQSQFIDEAIKNKTELSKVSLLETFPQISYFKQHNQIHPILAQLLNRLSLSDIILVDRNGNVAYTVKKNLNLGTNLVSGLFANSRLAQAYKWSLNAPPHAVKFFDFAPLAYFLQNRVAFFATPVFNQSEYIGTFLLQIPLERIDTILSENREWKKMGLGKTGEVTLFGDEGLMRNNSRLFLQEPQKFFSEIKKVNSYNGTVDLIKKFNSTSMFVSLDNESTQKYLNNSDLFETSTDYLGHSAIKSIGRLDLPGGGKWVITAKMDSQEALIPATKNLASLGILVLLASAAGLALSYFCSMQFSKGYKTLAIGLKKLKDFEFDQQLPEQNNEQQEVFKNFNELRETVFHLKDRNFFLENIIQSVQEAFFIVDIQGDKTNPTLTIRNLNTTAADMIGLPMTALHGADLKNWIETDYKKVIESLNNDQSSTLSAFETNLKKSTGKNIPLEVTWAPIKGTHSLFLIIGRDIRWKKEIEEQLKIKEDLLKESQAISKTGSFRWDVQTGKCIWSEEEFNILGLDANRIAPTYDLFRSMILPEDLPTFDETLRLAHQNSLPFHLDFRMRKMDSGEIIWVRAQGRTEYDDYGNALYMYGTTQDITELRRVEQSLIATKDEALKSSQAKSEFLARMSHEIRTPMNAIMGMAELLKETKLDADQQYYVTIFCKAGEVLMALINDILDLSKIEAGEVSIENIPFDLNKLLKDVEDMMRPRAQEKGLSYSFEISPGVSPYLMGDPTKLRQVLINLVSNSLKFTESGFIKITVGKNPAKKDTLMISVTDSGVGIPTSKQHLIFQKFSQADSSITRKFGGTGLGLAISKSLIELMGGQIWFKSREGQGTTFIFTMPYREQIQNPFSQKPLLLQKGDLDFIVPKLRDPNKKIRILIADDTEDNRTLFTHFLKNGPYEIIEAENGLEAIDKIKSGQFDIVFMDVQMPEMDGYAATNAIRRWEEEAHHEHTPIIALTAHALSEDRQKSLRAGCDDHIAKPFKKDTLLEVINRYSL